ncbi:ribosomal protein S25 [Lachnospiraceae bacterium PF1-22]
MICISCNKTIPEGIPMCPFCKTPQGTPKPQNEQQATQPQAPVQTNIENQNVQSPATTSLPNPVSEVDREPVKTFGNAQQPVQQTTQEPVPFPTQEPVQTVAPQGQPMQEDLSTGNISQPSDIPPDVLAQTVSKLIEETGQMPSAETIALALKNSTTLPPIQEEKPLTKKELKEKAKEEKRLAKAAKVAEKKEQKKGKTTNVDDQYYEAVEPEVRDSYPVSKAVAIARIMLALGMCGAILLACIYFIG